MTIASERVDELARRLARLTGEDVETALARAVEERLSRIESDATEGDRQAAMRRFFERVSEMAVLDARPVDEILGYGPDGLPH